MKKQTVVAAIFARGGSKGVPRKNVRLLAGKPLIAYAIEAALASKLVDRLIVSTEDQEIADVARQFGAEVPFMRPKELARDDSPEWLAWRHAIQMLTEAGDEIDVLVSVPPTSPFRIPADIDLSVQKLAAGDSDLIITVKRAERNPYFNMVMLDGEGYAQLAIPSAQTMERRQDAPPVYDMTTVVYAAAAGYILNANSMFEGKVRTNIIPPERALDIDTEFDFLIAELLMDLKSTAGN